ncbi:unnamed protein product [Camellia sinensis]
MFSLFILDLGFLCLSAYFLRDSSEEGEPVDLHKREAKRPRSEKGSRSWFGIGTKTGRVEAR